MHVFTIVLLTVTVIVFFLGTLIICTSERPSIKHINSNVNEGSISEKIFLDINGSNQGLFIKSSNQNNPVLLYLHGGMPDYFLTQKYPTGLEKYFTVVWWEQRGSGISFNKGLMTEKITTRVLIEDTKTLSKHLIKRFGTEKIYLMGHSGGTFPGIQVAAESPELFYAYIAVSQITNQLKSEKLAISYMALKYEQLKRKKTAEKLNNIDLSGDKLPDSYLQIRDKSMHSLGIGTMREMKSIITGLFFQSLIFKEYTVCEKFKLWQAKKHGGVTTMWNEIITTDITAKIPELNIPVYFFHGIYDYTVSYQLALSYFEKIKAPEKKFFSFTQSAHSPIFEEPKKCCNIINEYILKN